jgi:tripartite-type tricarboxylate transporter receptor subunit TctC
MPVTSLKRSASIPEVPTVAESGLPDIEASSWFGVLGPRDLPRDIVDKLHAEAVRIMKVPEIRDKLIQQGADPVASTPESSPPTSVRRPRSGRAWSRFRARRPNDQRVRHR